MDRVDKSAVNDAAAREPPIALPWTAAGVVASLGRMMIQKGLLEQRLAAAQITCSMTAQRSALLAADCGLPIVERSNVD